MELGFSCLTTYPAERCCLPVPSSKYLSCGRFGCCFKTGVATGLCQGCWPGDCIGIDKLTFVTLIGVQILLNLQVAVNFIYL
ncbi:hypothetical protein M758_1G087900 [Ceratodon purpureus]|nr:hypothetical protein M758_1G087900 [Ceratodon purpureus]